MLIVGAASQSFGYAFSGIEDAVPAFTSAPSDGAKVVVEHNGVLVVLDEAELDVLGIRSGYNLNAALRNGSADVHTSINHVCETGGRCERFALFQQTDLQNERRNDTKKVRGQGRTSPGGT